jgi:hypothetical protein
MTYVHTLTPTEEACGVTLAAVARVLPQCLLIDGGAAVVLPVNTPPALAGSVARVALSDGATAVPVTFSHLAQGYPVYRREAS